MSETEAAAWLNYTDSNEGKISEYKLEGHNMDLYVKYKLQAK
jgi:hypothetical protein